MIKKIICLVSLCLAFLFGKAQDDLLNFPIFMGEVNELVDHFDDKLFLDLRLDIASDTIKVDVEFDGMGHANYLSITKNKLAINQDTLAKAVETMPTWFPAHDMNYQPNTYRTTLNIIVVKNRVVRVVIKEDLIDLTLIDEE